MRCDVGGNVLVTGGAGYLGSVLVPVLLERAWRVTVLDRFVYDQTSLLACCPHTRFAAIRGDCRDEAVLRRAMAGADVVIPLAALVGAPACAADETAARTVNLDAVRLILKLRSPTQRVIFPTTNSGYGIGAKGVACTEESPLNPISLYGVTKVEAERAVLDGGNCVTFRLATVFGTAPRMRIDLLVNDFVYRAVHDRTVVVFEGHAKRNYVHIRDVARAFLYALDNFDRMRDRAYNVGLSDANLSKLELCERIKQHLPEFVYLEAPVGEDPDKRDYVVSNERIERAGFRTAHSLDAGIRELIRGYAMLRNARYGNV
jgi:nucleoside-diphosphate-sugar epimerase